LALFCSFYKENIGSKIAEFELFEGATLKEKEVFYSKILDEEYDSEDLDIAKKAEIIKSASSTIGRTFAIWYNGLGSDQKTVKEQLDFLEKEENENQELIESLKDE
jgi:hypothetical protein